MNKSSRNEVAARTAFLWLVMLKYINSAILSLWHYSRFKFHGRPIKLGLCAKSLAWWGKNIQLTECSTRFKSMGNMIVLKRKLVWKRGKGYWLPKTTIVYTCVLKLTWTQHYNSCYNAIFINQFFSSKASHSERIDLLTQFFFKKRPFIYIFLNE